MVAENTDPVPDDVPEEHPLLHESAYRLAIAVEYVKRQRLAPPEQWYGKDSTISKMTQSLDWIPGGSRNVCVRIMNEVWQHKEAGEEGEADLGGRQAVTLTTQPADLASPPTLLARRPCHPAGPLLHQGSPGRLPPWSPASAAALRFARGCT